MNNEIKQDYYVKKLFWKILILIYIIFIKTKDLKYTTLKVRKIKETTFTQREDKKIINNIELRLITLVLFN